MKGINNDVKFSTYRCAAIAVGLLSSTSLVTIPCYAQAQPDPQTTPSAPSGQLGEIVVTAQKRGENLQNVPISVASFDASALQAGAVQTATDLARVTPGLITQQSGGLLQPFLRGIGNPATAVGNESSTAMYVDGVYYSRLPYVFFDFADIERIEVLKGPQGTLFGRNSSGGLIHLITRDPTDSFSGQVSAGYANYEKVGLDGFVGGPLAPGVRASLSATYKKQFEGWGTNLTTGQEAHRSEVFATRGKLLFELGPDTILRLSADYVRGTQDIAPTSAYRGTRVGLPGPPFGVLPVVGFYDRQNNLQAVRKDKSWGGSARLSHDLGFAEFVSLTSYRDEKGFTPNDADQTPRPANDAFISYKNRTITQEFQLTSHDSDNLEWVLGIYYFNNKAGFDPVSLAIGPDTRLHIFGAQKIKSYSAYGQGTYRLTPTTRATVGLRYTRDDISARGHNDVVLGNGTVVPGTVITPKDDFNKLTYRFILDQKILDNALAYISYSRGYKSATYNTIPVSNIIARPETLDAYEIGLKSELFNRRVRLNVAAFRYDVENPQVSIYTPPSNFIENAGSARVYGIEGDTEFLITDELRAKVNATYLDAEYKSYQDAPFIITNPNPPFGNLPAAGDASGNTMILAPALTLSAALTYTVETSAGRFVVNGNYYHNSGFFWTVDNRLKEPASDLFGASLTYTLPSDKVSITVWGANLTGEKYYTTVNAFTGPQGYLATPAAPRTYGITLKSVF